MNKNVYVSWLEWWGRLKELIFQGIMGGDGGMEGVLFFMFDKVQENSLIIKIYFVK